MHVKIDTKEKFHEIGVLENELSANMTADINKMLSGLLEHPVKNVIVQMEAVKQLSMEAAETLAAQQVSFYEHGASFVICCLQPAVEQQLEEAGLLESLNTTPTLSEAWDIVQMEEIEREYLDGF